MTQAPFIVGIFFLAYGMWILKRPYTLTRFNPYFSRLSRDNTENFLSVARAIGYIVLAAGIFTFCVLFLAVARKS